MFVSLEFMGKPEFERKIVSHQLLMGTEAGRWAESTCTSSAFKGKKSCMFDGGDAGLQKKR